VKMSVNDQVLIDQFRFSGSARFWGGEAEFEAHKKTPILLEYSQRGGRGVMKFYWARTTGANGWDAVCFSRNAEEINAQSFSCDSENDVLNPALQMVPTTAMMPFEGDSPDTVALAACQVNPESDLANFPDPQDPNTRRARRLYQRL